MRTALIQMSVAADREENIARACAFLREAAARDTGSAAGDVLLSLSKSLLPSLW